jgi:hypothetical protein
LSDRPGAKVWRDFFETMRPSISPDELGPDECMADRPMNLPPRERVLFSEEQ